MLETALSGGNLHHKGFQGRATNTHAYLVPALVMVQIWVGHQARELQRPLLASITTIMQLPLYLYPETSVAHAITSKQLQEYHGPTDALRTLQKQDFGEYFH